MTSGNTSSTDYYGSSGANREVKCSDSPNTALLQKIANQQRKVALVAQIETARYLSQISAKEDMKAQAEKRQNEKEARRRQYSSERAQRGKASRNSIPLGRVMR